MIDDTTLPPDLISAIGSEPRDFIVKAKRSQPVKVSLALIVFGAVWFLFSCVFVILFMGPVFQGREVQFLANDVPTVAGPGNLKPLLVPGLIIGFFVLIGILLLFAGFRMLLKKGGWFVGTPTRLISFKNGSYRSIDWEQFSGDIEVSGNARKGNLTLGMRSGKMVSSKNGPDRYVPETLYISGIENVSEIEQLCRRRIKENDPTPPATGTYIR